MARVGVKCTMWVSYTTRRDTIPQGGDRAICRARRVCLAPKTIANAYSKRHRAHQRHSPEALTSERPDRMDRMYGGWLLPHHLFAKLGKPSIPMAQTDAEN